MSVYTDHTSAVRRYTGGMKTKLLAAMNQDPSHDVHAFVREFVFIRFRMTSFHSFVQ